MLAGNRLSDSGVVPRPLLPVRNKSESVNFNRAFHNLIKNLKVPSVSGFSNNHGVNFITEIIKTSHSQLIMAN